MKLRFIVLLILLTGLVFAGPVFDVGTEGVRYISGDPETQGRVMAFIEGGSSSVTQRDIDVINTEILSYGGVIDEIDLSMSLNEIDSIREQLKDQYLSKVSSFAGKYAIHMFDSIDHLVDYSSFSGEIYTFEMTDFSSGLRKTGSVSVSGEELLYLEEGFGIGDSMNTLTVVSDGRGNEAMRLDGKDLYTSAGSFEVTGEKEMRTLTIRTGMIERFIASEGNEFIGVSEGSFTFTDEGNVVDADFVSNEGGVYRFTHNDDIYRFSVAEGARIIFHPSDGEINLVGGGDFSIEGTSHAFESKDGVQVRLDNEGNLVSATFSKGSTYIDNENYRFRAKGGELEVFFEVPVGGLESVEGNAVFVSGEKALMKGNVIMDALGNDISYEALSSDAFTSFDKLSNHFDVIQGDGRLSNGKHEVLLEKGKVKLSTVDLDKSAKDRFSFSYLSDDGEQLTGTLLEGVHGQEGYFSLSIDGVEQPGVQLLQAASFSFTDSDIRGGTVQSVTDRVLESNIRKVEHELSTVKNALATAKDAGDNTLITELEGKVAQLSFVRDSMKIQQLGMSEIPQSVRITTSESIRNIGTGLGKGDSFDVSQSVDLEVNSNGEVLGYSLGGKRYPLNEFYGGGLAAELSDKNRLLLENIADNGYRFDSAHLAGADSVESLGLAKDSPLYRRSVDRADALINDLEISRRLAISSDNPTLARQIDLEIGKALVASRQTDVALSHFGGLVASGSSDKGFLSDAYMQLAAVELQAGGLSRSVQVNEHLKRAVALDPENVGAGEIYRNFRMHELDTLKSLALAESGKTKTEIDALYGSSAGYSVGNVLDVAFRPVTNFELSTQASRERFAAIQEANFGLSALRATAYDDASMMISQGIDVVDFLGSSDVQQFSSLYALGENSIIPRDTLNGYLAEVGTDPTKLQGLVARDFGPDRANEFGFYAGEIYASMGALSEAAAHDLTFREIVSGGRELPVGYTGSESPNDLFAATRLAGAVEVDYTGTEKAVLGAADVVLNPLSYLGVSGAVRAGVVKGFAGEVAAETVLEVGAQVVPGGEVLQLADFTGRGVVGGLKALGDSGRAASHLDTLDAFNTRSASRGDTVYRVNSPERAQDFDRQAQFLDDTYFDGVDFDDRVYTPGLKRQVLEGRSGGNIGEVNEHLRDGLLVDNAGEPLTGNFIYSVFRDVDENGNEFLRFSYSKESDNPLGNFVEGGSDLPSERRKILNHNELANDRGEVLAAGEVAVVNGRRLTWDAETGHFVNMQNVREFNSDVTRKFDELATDLGWLKPGQQAPADALEGVGAAVARRQREVYYGIQTPSLIR